MRFSDEKRFSLRTDGPVRVWRRREDRFLSDYCVEKVKFQLSIMVWLCIAADGSSRLCLCDDRQNSLSYQRTILTPNLNFIRRRATGRRPPLWFMHDGATCHTSMSTRQFLRLHRARILPWPAMSPDLNPVEHCWSMIARKMRTKIFKTKEDLWAGVQTAWGEISPQYVQNLYGSMPRRLQAVKDAKGGATKY